jgi:predicted ATPase
MITAITAKNFKAFESFKIHLKPITILVGPNNSGKSSIISVIRLLSQTAESFDISVPLLLNGAFGDFGTYKDIIYGNLRARKLELGITFEPNFFGMVKRDYKTISIDLSFKYRVGRREIILNSISLKADDKEQLRTEYSIESEKQLIQKIGEIEIPTALKSRISKFMRIQNFIPQRVMVPYLGESKLRKLLPADTDRIYRTLNRISYDINHEFGLIDYVGAMRLPPERTYLSTGASRSRVGANGQFASNILALDSAKGGKKSKNILSNVKEWLIQAGIASDIKIEQISDRHYEIKIQHPKSKEYQNFADVGFGNSQVLPVLISGFNLKDGGTFIVEQPEIHLHPHAQAELGDFFSFLLKKKVQSIIETHSEHLILRLQQHVIVGNIKPEEMNFLYVHAPEDKKVITEMHLDENGKFTTEWPEGFFPDRLVEAQKIAQKRFFKKQN